MIGNPGMTVATLVVGFLLLEGIGSGIAAIVLFLKRKAKYENCERIAGNVVEIKERPGSEGPLLYPVVRYISPSGKEAVIEARWAKSNLNLKSGDRIDVMVDRYDPTKVEVADFIAQWLLPIFLGANAVISFIMAPVMFFIITKTVH